MEEKYSKGRINAALIGCTLILASSMCSTSIMNAVLPEIIAGVNADLTVFMIGPTVATVAAFLAGLVGAKMIDFLTPKWALMIGSVCVSIVMFMVGIATSVETWILANLVNGVVLAFGAYASVAGVLAEFKGAKTQQVFGVVTGAAAFVISAFVAIAAGLMNVMGYRDVFFVFAAIVLLVGVLSNVFLIGKMPSRAEQRERKQKMEAAKAAAEEAKAQGKAEDAAAEKAPIGLTLKQALKTPALYLFLLAMFFGAWALNGLTTYLSMFLTTFEMSVAEAAMWTSVLGVYIAILKIGSGWFIKKFGTKALAVAIAVCFTGGIALLLLWAVNGDFFLIAIGLLLAAMIGFVTILPGLYISDIFGMRDYTGLNSVGMAIFYLGGACLMMVFAGIISSTGIFSAYVILIVCGLLSMGCLLVALIMSPVKKLKKEDAQ